jgi:galactokinase
VAIVPARADRLLAAFPEVFGRAPAVLSQAPGRVSLLGAHIDYSEGRVLPAAIDRAVCAAAAPSPGPLWRLHALDLCTTIEIDPANLPPPVAGQRAADWGDYPRGLLWALRAAGLPTWIDTADGPRGLDVVFGGDVPAGAGVSSSAAVEVALLLAFAAAAGLELDGRCLAELGRAAENGYLGVMSGLMDQLASLFGAADHAVLIDCRTLEIATLPLPADVRIVVVDSGVRRRLAESSFNDRRAECREAVDRLRVALPGIATLRDVGGADLERHQDLLPPTLLRRARHAVEELVRVDVGADALRRGDLEAFGRLMRQSQDSSRDLYQVSLPELDLLCATAWATPGCWGARLVGGGFGGCVAALVDASAVEAVQERLDGAFLAAYGRRPPSFVTRAGEGASSRRLA